MTKTAVAPMPPPTTEPSRVPDGWACIEVQEAFNSFGGGTPNRGTSTYWGGSIPWISSGDVKAERLRLSTETITKAGLANSSANLCAPGSVLVVVRSGILKHTLPVAILESEAAINQDIKCFDSGNLHLNEWLALALRSSAREILAANREGTTVQSVKYETLKQFELAVPPGAEQTRILATVDEALNHVNAGRDRLATIPKILKRFRQSVLAAACSGRLTEDWRQLNPDDELADDIVRAIYRRREADASSEALKVRLRAIYENAEENESNVLPKNWRFVALNKLCSSFDYGSSAKSKPSGSMPVLRMGNIQNGEIDWSALAYTSDKRELENYSLQPKTVLFNRTNSPELVGKSAIFRGERPAIFAGYLIRINHLPELDPEYLNICLNTDYAKEFCSRVKTDGVSQSNINAQKLGSFEVPFCGLEEQREIVRRVEALFKLADAIEKRVAAAQTRVDKLTQSILAKAFCGELVPTEAELAKQEGREYEPASVLLERICAQRAASVPAPASRGRKQRRRAAQAK